MTSPADVAAAERAVAQVAQLRGRCHPETLFQRAELARRRAEAVDLPGAIRDYEELLPDLVSVLGRDSAGTLDIGTADFVGDRHATIADYERRARELLDRVDAMYGRLL